MCLALRLLVWLSWRYRGKPPFMVAVVEGWLQSMHSSDTITAIARPDTADRNNSKFLGTGETCLCSPANRPTSPIRFTQTLVEYVAAAPAGLKQPILRCILCRKRSSFLTGGIINPMVSAGDCKAGGPVVGKAAPQQRRILPVRQKHRAWPAAAKVRNARTITIGTSCDSENIFS